MSVSAGLIERILSEKVLKPLRGVADILDEIATQKVQRMEQGYRQLRSAGLTAEREELFRLTRRGRISDEISRKLIRNLDLLETRQRD